MQTFLCHFCAKAQKLAGQGGVLSWLDDGLTLAASGAMVARLQPIVEDLIAFRNAAERQVERAEEPRAE